MFWKDFLYLSSKLYIFIPIIICYRWSMYVLLSISQFITQPLNWVIIADGIILLVLHFSWVCFILVLINYKQDSIHICRRHCGWFCCSQVITIRVRLNVRYESTCVCSCKMFALPQSNTHKIKLNFKVIHKHSGINSQFQSYSK